MLIFKCKMCGGTIEFDPGATVGVCDSCGTKQTLPRLDDDRRANLYDRANHFRRANEFDKAAGLYEQILNEDTTDAEAYWSLVLCQYGIEYVEDPATHKRIPTVNRAQFTSIFDDDNYKSAIQYADSYQRDLYEKEAAAINEIQKGILAISQKEEPFDVFICYKETDNNGRRTQDSVLANDLYYQLTQEGFKVFFSRITLEDKLGTAYEPYIFAALNSARVMVVLGTRPEHFNAVWVKNEWSRYLSLVKQSGGKKVLIPAYRDMDPYDLPEEFSHLQAQDMSKLGFMQDLIRGIKKITKADETKATVKETVVSGSNNANVAPLLEKVILFLEDGKWKDANIYCDKVLDIDPKNAEAHLGKLMADLEVSTREQLADCSEPFDDKESYEKVIRFGDEKLETEMRGYIAQINERNENARLTWVYNVAVNAMNAANSEAAFKAAAEMFKTIPGFKDADSLAQQCLRKAEERALRVDYQVEAVTIAVKKKKAGSVSLAEQLAIEKAQLSKTIHLVQVFDSIAGEIQNAKSKVQRNEEEIEALRTKRASLGLFAGKEKKQIDKEIQGLETKNNIIELTIESKTEELKGFSTRQEVEASVQQINGKISELEAKVQEAENSGNAELAYAQAIKIYLSDKDVRARVNAKYPELVDDFTTIEFGSYYQLSGNSKEPIEWLILEREGSNLLLISKYALDCQPYNTSKTDVTWEKCSLRKWLNETFISNAFSSDEQKMIKTTNVTADKNPEYMTPPGNNTTDKVFLLSIPEVNKYFSSDEARQCVPTEYAKAQGVGTALGKSVKRTSNWWLRSPGYDSSSAIEVSIGGLVFNNGMSVDRDGYGVRPALWINLES